MRYLVQKWTSASQIPSWVSMDKFTFEFRLEHEVYEDLNSVFYKVYKNG